MAAKLHWTLPVVLLYCCMAPLTAYLGVEAVQQHRTGKAVLELAASAGWLTVAIIGGLRLSRSRRDSRL